VRKNLLGWGRYYHIDFNVMNYVSMDVMDWGVVGFDAHKFTERLVISYSLYDLPHLIMDFVLSFLYD
jgi:arginine utilization protein RocB